MKIVIIGNSGSGKTWLAKELVKVSAAAIIHLDELFWEPGGFDRKRAPDDVLALVEQSKLRKDWIVEGVFGELAQLYLDQADVLIWLDLDWDVCRTRLELRGSESKLHLDRAQSDEGLTRLICWAKEYYSRTDLRSKAGHQTLFEKFRGTCRHLNSEAEVQAFLRDTQHYASLTAHPER
jgi:adenylate kinase family enzyme